MIAADTDRSALLREEAELLALSDADSTDDTLARLQGVSDSLVAIDACASPPRLSPPSCLTSGRRNTWC